jgi:hypothetical protein
MARKGIGGDTLRLLALLVLLLGVCGLTLDAPVVSNATAAKDKGHAKGGHERHDDDGDDDGDDDDDDDQGNSGKGGEKDKENKQDKKDKKDKGDAPEPVQVVILE